MGVGGQSFARSRRKIFSAPLEHAPTEPLPPPRCSQGGGELAPLPEPEPWAPPQPAPQNVPVPTAPPAAPPQPGLDPSLLAEFVGVPVAEAPPPAASPELLGDTLDSSDDRRQPVPESGPAAPVPSPSASQPAIAFTAVPAEVDPTPPAPVPPTSDPPAEPMRAPTAAASPSPATPGEEAEVENHQAEPSSEPPLAPRLPAAATAAPAISLDSPPSFSGCPEAAPAGGAGTGEGDSGLPLRGGVVARQLIASSARLPAFKFSVFRGPTWVCFRGSRWGLECLTSPARPSGVREVAPEPSASGP
ncbi:uncharacterized protein LOC127060978 [Serinus canaria]|uniref:uncharacterized protein LOC127060978 n=1 Tax=Serinus canaria TaxID=9135 RepID=UPI0021CD1893|nr:uncharacterized protein LOC127060978 [Serinus canaria]